MDRQGAVRGDVVGDELAEEWPTGGDILRIVTALGIDNEPTIAETAHPSQGPEQRLISHQRRELGEETAVGMSAQRCVDRARGRQAVCAGELRKNRGHDTSL